LIGDAAHKIRMVCKQITQLGIRVLPDARSKTANICFHYHGGLQIRSHASLQVRTNGAADEPPAGRPLADRTLDGSIRLLAVPV
jgi:hypothetical protein